MKGGYTIFNFPNVEVTSTGTFLGPEWVKKCKEAVAANKPILVSGIVLKAGNLSVQLPAAFATIDKSLTADIWRLFVPTTKGIGEFDINAAGYISMSTT